MKKSYRFAVGCFLLLLSFHVKAQDSLVKSLIEKKEFIFEARSVTPAYGTLKILTDYYYLEITHDSLIVALPFFGRSFTAPMDPTSIGVEITTTKFSYDIKPKKKSSWQITIIPDDNTNIQQLTLTVFQSGTAYLDVVNTNRTPVSYNGKLKKIE